MNTENQTSFHRDEVRNSVSPLSEYNRSVNNESDNESSCFCEICSRKTTAPKRLRCTSCKNMFHEGCVNSSDVRSQDDWLCTKCTSTNEVSRIIASKFTRQIIVNQRIIRKINNAPRSKQCNLPPNHFGEIPGIPVGSCWQYRLQVSEVGVHRPLIAGIHGRTKEGAYSIVLSGVYAEDTDEGEQILYCGSGGTEKHPTKRLGLQVKDQTLTNHNKALALCCNAPFSEKGATANNWKKGKPVRVIRKHNPENLYAPKEGYRYDGIYKVAKYFKYRGHSGFMVWRFLLLRDDPTPAPWTPEGKKRIEELGLTMIPASPSIKQTAEVFEPVFKIEDDFENPLMKKIKKLRDDEVGLVKKRRSFEPLDISIERISHEQQIETVEVKIENVSSSPVVNENFMSPASVSNETPTNLVLTLDENCTNNSHTSNENSKSSNINNSKPPIRPNCPNYNLSDNSSVSSELVHSYLSLNSISEVGSNTSQSLPILQITVNNLQPLSRADKFVPLKKSIPVIIKTVGRNNTFQLSNRVIDLIQKDVMNKSVWEFTLEKFFPAGKQEFLEKVKEIFSCPCCAKLIDKPVTLSCEHSACSDCLSVRFEMCRVYSCPSCQAYLGPSTKFRINENLFNILLELFPAYNLKLSHFV